MGEFDFVVPVYNYVEENGPTGATGPTGENGSVGKEGIAFTKCAMYAGFVGKEVNVAALQQVPLDDEMEKTPEACMELENNKIHLEAGKYLVLVTVLVSHDEDAPILINVNKDKDLPVQLQSQAPTVESVIMADASKDELSTLTQTFTVEDTVPYDLSLVNASIGNLKFNKASFVVVHLEE